MIALGYFLPKGYLCPVKEEERYVRNIGIDV